MDAIFLSVWHRLVGLNCQSLYYSCSSTASYPVAVHRMYRVPSALPSHAAAPSRHVG